MYQYLLLKTPNLPKGHLKKFEILFSLLDFHAQKASTGRPPHPRSALLNALIYKNLRGLPTLADLARDLTGHPQIAQICGLSSFPPKERFSAFLRDTPNIVFQSVAENLIHQLIDFGQIKGKYISVDSCPIVANVKENNLKTHVAHRFDKSRIPKGDIDSRLGLYLTYIHPDIRKPEFFWGYRNFVLTDALSELPIAEKTCPANIYEQRLIIPQLKYIVETFHLPIKAIIGNSAFDSGRIIEFIVKELGAQPIIARNPRRSKPQYKKLSPKGFPVCLAGFEMSSRSVYHDKEQGRKSHKFICTIKASKKFAQENPWCPWNRPKFVNNRFGCVVNLRIDVDEFIRKSINYASQTFKKLYNLRASTERVFSRLLNLCMQEPSVKGLNATANLCTIAQISVLAVALTAVKTGHKDKIRFVKKFLPNL